MIIVTGGAGFIGSAVVWQLNQEGVQDILIVDRLGKTDKWKNLVGLQYKDYMEVDTFVELIEDDDMDDVDAIIHLGACSATTEVDAGYLIHNNFEFSKLLAVFCLEKEARYIYASSAATYGGGEHGYDDDPSKLYRLKPLNMYGYSKQMMDQWAYHHHVLDKMVSLKYFNVFGPNEYHKEDMRSMVHKAFGQIQDKGQVNLFKSHREDYLDGEQKRDFVYIKDAVKMTLFFLKHPDLGGIFNIGTGQARSWNDMMKAMFVATGQKEKISYIDMPDHIRNQYQYFTEANIAKIKAAGYQEPLMSLEDAIEDYVKEYLLKDAFLAS